jgi:MFS family permease
VIALLRQPKLRRFFYAHAQSQIGTGASYVALLLVAYHRLHSSWAVTLVLLSDFLPAMVLGPCFGVLADRHSRRALAIGADLLRVGAFAGLALVGSFAPTVALALVAGVGTALFRPTVNAALPTLVADEERSSATALYGAFHSAGFTLGPAFCGLVLLFGPATWVLLANAATFLVSAMLLTGVPMGGKPAPAAEDSEDRESAWQDAKAGARYAARERPIIAVLATGAITVLCGSIINVAEPLLAVGPLHAGSSGFSILISVFGLGLVAGSTYTSRMGSKLSVLRARYLAGIAVSGAATLAIGAAGGLVAALVPFALFGFSNALILTPETRLIQELSAERFRGRVFGLRDSVECGCFALAFIGAGALLSAAGPRSIFVLSGVLLIATAAAGVVALRLPKQAAIRPAPIAAEAEAAA